MMRIESSVRILEKRWKTVITRSEEGEIVLKGPKDQIDRMKLALYEEKNPVVAQLVMEAKRLFLEYEEEVDREQMKKNVEEVLNTEFREQMTLEEIIREKRANEQDED